MIIVMFLASHEFSSSLATTSTSTSGIARTILITGATDGIGHHTAKRLAADGCHLLVHGKRPTVGATLTSDLLQRGASSVQYFNADLGDLKQVHRLAEEILEATTKDSSPHHIDVLINNAGIFDPPIPAKSAQGYDLTWAVNVMAPYVLTRKLLPLLVKSPDPCPRIITTSSISKSYTLPSLDELFDINNQPKSGHTAYSHSKLGDLLFTVHLSNLLQSCGHEKLSKIKCLTMDPGTVNTKMLLAGWGPCGIPISQADNTYQLATDYGTRQESGSYHFGGGTGPDVSNQSKLTALFAKLEEHTGVSYANIAELVPK